jgi:hypothetical protein
MPSQFPMPSQLRKQPPKRLLLRKLLKLTPNLPLNLPPNSALI